MDNSRRFRSDRRPRCADLTRQALGINPALMCRHVPAARGKGSPDHLRQDVVPPTSVWELWGNGAESIVSASTNADLGLR